MEQLTGSKLGEEYDKGVLSPCLFNFYAEHIMQNAGLDESQNGIKIAGRNIYNLSYANDTTLTEESEEELKSLLIKVKEQSEKASLKFNIQKTKISIQFCNFIANRWGKGGSTDRFYFPGLQNHYEW